VTGTAKQAVAENYNSAIFKAMQANNQIFAKVADDFVKQVLPTLTTTNNWQWCQRENSTYLDCPTSEYPNEANITIAAFNPVATPSDYISVAVKHAKYDVSVYDYTTKAFVAKVNNTAASVVCENETLSNGYTINNCWLHVDYEIDGHQIGII